MFERNNLWSVLVHFENEDGRTWKRLVFPFFLVELTSSKFNDSPNSHKGIQNKNHFFFFLSVTQEYRENLTKIAKATCEQSKQSIRKIRQKGMSDVKKNKKGRSDDDVKMVEKMVMMLIYLLIDYL